MQQFNKKKLKNGLTILHEKRDTPVTTVMLAVNYGAMYESASEKGVAHFMEHLCFKGTGKRNAKEIAFELEKVGGELNAFTHEEITAYHVRLPKKYLELGIDVIGDIFFNPSFPAEEIKKESNVICEEIKMYKDNPRAYVLDKIKEGLYEKPFGMFIAGTEETVRGMNREFLIKRHRSTYVPENSVLCIVGNNDFKEVVKFAEKYLMIFRKGSKNKKLKIKTKIAKKEEKRKDILQTNLAIGFHFPKLSDKQRYAAEVFSAILGEGMSSKLFTEVREKRGLVYGVRTELDIGRNYGYMIIWAGTDDSKKKEVIDICLREFEKMKNVSEEELKEAKIQVIGKREVEKETGNSTAVGLIMEEFCKGVKNYYNYNKKINSVKLKDIKKLASNIKFASFVLGP